MATLHDVMEQIHKLNKKILNDAAEEISEYAVDRAQEFAPVRQVFKEKSTKRPRYRVATGAELDYLRRGRPEIMKGNKTLPGMDSIGGRMSAGRGRGEILIRQRGSVNRRGLGGPVGNRVSGLVLGVEARSGAVFGKATRAFGGEKTVPGKGRYGSRKEAVIGYRLQSKKMAQSLTARARYDLLRRSSKSVGRTPTRFGRDQLVFGGNLKRSIKADVTPTANGRGMTIYLHADVPYAKYVEYGTYKDRAQPFLYPALKMTKRQMNSIIRKHLQAAGIKSVR